MQGFLRVPVLSSLARLGWPSRSETPSGGQHLRLGIAAGALQKDNTEPGLLRRERPMPTRYEYRPEYGTDGPWPNVVWSIIAIVCACALAVLPFMD